MKHYRKELWFEVPARRAFINIHRGLESPAVGDLGRPLGSVLSLFLLLCPPPLFCQGPIVEGIPALADIQIFFNELNIEKSG